MLPSKRVRRIPEKINLNLKDTEIKEDNEVENEEKKEPQPSEKTPE